MINLMSTMLRITEIKGEDIYFNNGKYIWILYYQALCALDKGPDLCTEDCIKVGKAMSEIGYGDSDIDEWREELRFSSPHNMYSDA